MTSITKTSTSATSLPCPELSPNEMETVNGCGSSYWPVYLFRIPRWISKKIFCCCNCHDISYQYKRDKEIADLELRACIRNVALTGPKWQRWLKFKLADIVYFAITSKISDSCYRKA